MKKPRPVSIRGLQAVVGPLAADQRRPDGVGLIMRRRCRAGEIVDVVETRKLAPERLHDVVLDQVEPPTGHQAAHVRAPSGVEVVDADHMMTFVHQAFAKVRAEKASPTRYDNGQPLPRAHASGRRKTGKIALHRRLPSLPNPPPAALPKAAGGVWRACTARGVKEPMASSPQRSQIDHSQSLGSATIGKRVQL